MTVNLWLQQAMKIDDVRTLYRERYASEPLIHVIDEAPWVSRIAGWHGVEIGGFTLAPGGKRLVVVATLDNLLKGAATQAMQNLNQAFGFNEFTAIPAVSYTHLDVYKRQGYTWYAPRVQRTGLNTEAKLLLFGHAFDTLGCISVVLETSWFNHRSRTAIARLGARQDGVLRNHRRHADGTVRDSVIFSILDTEWPAVRSNLLARLAQHEQDRCV